MGCYWCNGYWVCEPGIEDPCSEAAMPWRHQGRYRIAAGTWRVWCRSGGAVRDVAISSCEPPDDGGRDWEEAGCIDFAAGAYDVWTEPGNGCAIKIQSAADECGGCEPDDPME